MLTSLAAFLMLKNLIDKLTTQFHTFLLICLYVADPATFVPSNSVLGTYYPLRTACLITYGNNKYF